MNFDGFQKIHDKQDLEVAFQCLEDDGVTKVDLTAPGYVELSLWRTGLKPFSILTSSEDSGAVDWGSPSTRSQGSGLLVVPIQDMELPSGVCRIQLRSIDKDNRARVQVLGFAVVVKTR